jgi:hypothetical protein
LTFGYKRIIKEHIEPKRRRIYLSIGFCQDEQPKSLDSRTSSKLLSFSIDAVKENFNES